MYITVLQSMLEANDKKAEELRKLLHAKKITMLNLISSPGSGKTSLLEKTLPRLNKMSLRAAVIEGDVETDADAKRLAGFGSQLSLINTQGSCHLESVSIEKALTAFDLNALDLVFIENVGNLVCPAEFDVGEDAKIALISVPEGDDKILKYPLLFRECALVILNKIDLLPYTNFSRARFYQELNQLNPAVETLEISCVTEQGLNEWVAWLERKIAKKK